jgi:voltage-gated potassium channel
VKLRLRPLIRDPEKWIERRIERTGLRPRDAAYLIATFWALAVVTFAVVERLVDPKSFPTIWLALWWAVETVTTVGYGDVVPNQTAGKFIGAFLMLGGLSMIAVITAAITSGFVSRAQDQRVRTGPGDAEAARDLRGAQRHQGRTRPTSAGLGQRRLANLVRGLSRQ